MNQERTPPKDTPRIDDSREPIAADAEEAHDINEETWLKRSREAYEGSREWMEQNVRRQWRRNLANFRSRHPEGSKYHSEAYKRRSTLFRPKTRNAIRRNEAHAAAAFFQNAELVSLEPRDDGDPRQLASAEVFKEILQHRLDKDIPWFQTVIGAFQDAMVHGICVSKQTWEYTEEMHEVETVLTDPVTGLVVQDSRGKPVIHRHTEMVRVVDRPRIELLEPENIRIDAGADWRDPIGTSPFVIHIIPMRLDEIKKQMESHWHPLDEEFLLAAASETEAFNDSIQHQRLDRNFKKGQSAIRDYSILNVHENFIRYDGQDWVFFTLGTKAMLSDPVRVTDIYPHGRPFVMGTCIIESHRLYPAGLVELSQDLQSAINEVQNQRFDNVQLVLNKRYFARRGSGVDLKSLTRNVPGSVTMMTNPESDVVVHHTPDITSSAYEEQQLLNADFDSAIGTFDQGSVNVNRQLNETVGGMNILSADANLTTEYLLRVFVETWAEPVLRQLVKLEQRFETDEFIIAMAGRRSPLVQRFGFHPIIDRLLEQELTVRINVGVGATNVHNRLERFLLGARTVSDLLGVAPDAKQLISEVFGLLGYKDGARFYPQLDAPPAAPLQDPLVEVEQEKVNVQREALHLQRQIEAARLQTRREEKLRTDALKKTELATKAQLERLRIQAALATGSTSGLRQGLRR
ncbi:MAG: hypothetical protein HQL84_09960 [Magnetococcales bacterium]|nr:hypothetical protein [Magnetococcales bacterium]MBF0150355.1 hypothetical protein [Magnetococcales bacterium]MBF0632149.1 hypothetical protein [Magnetococcales bacterium]